MTTTGSALPAESLGDVIRKAREDKGVTQKELAKRCGGVTSMFNSQIETGERLPSATVCIRLAKALDLDQKGLLRMTLRAKVPTEMKDLVVEEHPESYGDSRLAKLLRDIDQLPRDKQDQMVRIVEAALEGFAR